jgi:hypothetical protein
MILYRHHEHKLLFAVGSTTLSTSPGTIMNYATTSSPTDLPAPNGPSLIHHSITLGDGESSDRFVLRNVLINYLIGNTQNRIIALNPKHNHYQNKGNLLLNLTPKLHPDISTKHNYMTFLLSYNRGIFGRRGEWCILRSTPRCHDFGDQILQQSQGNYRGGI